MPELCTEVCQVGIVGQTEISVFIDTGLPKDWSNQYVAHVWGQSVVLFLHGSGKAYPQLAE